MTRSKSRQPSSSPLAGSMFRVEDDHKHQILAAVGGKLRRHSIRILPGDRVLVELGPDVNHGTILSRLR